MKILFFLLGLLVVGGCIEQAPYTFSVIDDTVIPYTIPDIASYETTVIYETVIETEIKKVAWEGVLATTFGEGDTINFISEDGYMVSIPYSVKVILAYKKEGGPINEKEGGPLKIAVDPAYGCKCNWLKYLTIVEFVDDENAISVYGDVVNMITFSPRDLNLYYGLDAVRANTYTTAPLSFILEKVIVKQNATTIVFVTDEGRHSYGLQEVKDCVLVYDNGFHIHELGITHIKGIKIE